MNTLNNILQSVGWNRELHSKCRNVRHYRSRSFNANKAMFIKAAFLISFCFNQRECQWNCLREKYNITVSLINQRLFQRYWNKTKVRKRNLYRLLQGTSHVVNQNSDSIILNATWRHISVPWCIAVWFTSFENEAIKKVSIALLVISPRSSPADYKLNPLSCLITETRPLANAIVREHETWIGWTC